MSEELLQATSNAWLEQLKELESGDEEFETIATISGKLDWAQSVVNGSPSKLNAGSYALLREGDEHACAVVELTVPHKGTPSARVKLLTIRFEPNIDPELQGVSDKGAAERAQIFASCLGNVLVLTFTEFASTELKVYLRTNETRGVAASIATRLQDGILKGTGISVTTHGQWFVFKEL